MVELHLQLGHARRLEEEIPHKEVQPGSVLRQVQQHADAGQDEQHAGRAELARVAHDTLRARDEVRRRQRGAVVGRRERELDAHTAGSGNRRVEARTSLAAIDDEENGAIVVGGASRLVAVDLDDETHVEDDDDRRRNEARDERVDAEHRHGDVAESGVRQAHLSRAHRQRHLRAEDVAVERAGGED